MKKIQVTSRSTFYKLAALGISALILVGCGADKKDFGFQAQVPTSNKGLEEIFEDFSSVDTGDVSMGGVLDRAEDAVEMNHAITNTLLLELGRLSSPENPALPKMLDIVATAVDSSYRSYESLENGATDVNSAVEIGTRILDLPPATIMKGSKTLAKLIEYIGNMAILFPDDVLEDGSNRFPTLASWEQCESPRQYNSTFESVSDNSSVERKALVLTYDLLKISYCLYENIENYQPDIENPTAFMHNVLVTLKEQENAKQKIQDFRDYITENLNEIEKFEKKLADWLIADPEKAAVVSYLLSDAFKVVKKKWIMEDGRPLLDVSAMHLSQAKDSDGWYLSSILTNLNEDLPKISLIDKYVGIDKKLIMGDGNTPGISSYEFGRKILSSESEFAGASDNIPSALSYYDSSKSKVSRLLWDDGVNSLLNTGSGKGYIPSIASLRSTDSSEKPFRKLMQGRLAPGVEVPSSYNGETMMSAALRNVYYALMDTYYNESTNKWSLTREDGEENLQQYFSSLQYTVANMVNLNPCGQEAGKTCANSSAYGKVPYLAALNYTLAASNGQIDPVNAPATLTLKDSLKAMGASDIADDGVRTLNKKLGFIPVSINIEVACKENKNCATTVKRNGSKYATSLKMFDFELISPGRFVDRSGSSPVWKGSFSQHQGDIETTDIQTAKWVMSEFSSAAWEGYGPFTVQGKAPNGSDLKFKNSYFTDYYATKLKKLTKKGVNLWFVSFANEYTDYWNAMGANRGQNGGHAEGQGRYHIFESIYRPMKSNDPCWANSQQGKYGYLRPTNNRSYNSNNQCGSWSKVQVDFDSRDEAIRANFDWALKHKKYVFVIPMYGVGAEASIMGLPNMDSGNGASFSIFASINANGISGVTAARRAGPTKNNNGKWRKSPVNMGADSGGQIPNSGNGLISESASGGNYTSRYGATSFAAGDSMIALDITAYSWGNLTDSIVKDLNQDIWDTLGDGPVTPDMIGDNFSPILAMGEALYSKSDVLTANGYALTSDIGKFKKFYDNYFSYDVQSGDGSDGNDGSADLYQSYLVSKANPGCKDANGKTIQFCLTAQDLPPVPQVNGVSYPASFNADGSVSLWQTYNGTTEGKFTKFLTPFIMVLGTLHEDGGMHGNGTYKNQGLRKNIDKITNLLIRLNEMNKSPGSNLPSYEPYNNMLGVLIDGKGQSAGARKGALSTLLNSKYANVGSFKSLMVEIQDATRQQVQTIIDKEFKLLAGNEIHKLNYFLTNLEGKENYLSKVTFPDGKKGSPIGLQKEALKYLRNLTSDTDVKAALANGIPQINTLMKANDIDFELQLTEEDLEKIYAFLNHADADGNNTIETILNFLEKSQLNDLNNLRNADFEVFTSIDQQELENTFYAANDSLKSNFNIDLEKALLLSPILFGEPQCSSSDPWGGDENTTQFLDYNKNGKRDVGIVGDGRWLNFKAYKNYTVSVDSNESGWRGGSCYATIDIRVPTFLNFHSYEINIGKLVAKVDEEVLSLQKADSDKLVKILYGIDPDGRGSFYEHGVSDLLDNTNDFTGRMIANLLDGSRIDEPSYDSNGNGIIDEGEYLDLNKDGNYTTIAGIAQFASNSSVSGGEEDYLCHYGGEPYVDWNQNGSRDSGEDYVDKNNNGQYDTVSCSGTRAPTLRSLLIKGSIEYRSLYQKYEEDKNLSEAVMVAMNDLFNPQCTTFYQSAGSLEFANYSATCSAEGSAENAQYLTGDLFDAWQEFDAAANYTPEELLALQRFVGTFLYDQENGKYTAVVHESAKTLPQIISAFSDISYIEGENNDLIDMGIYVTQPDGLLSYIYGNISLAQDQTYYDAFGDYYDLINNKRFRCYEGKDGCDDVPAEEMFWPQISEVMLTIADTQYEKNKTSELYDGIRDIFERQ